MDNYTKGECVQDGLLPTDYFPDCENAVQMKVASASKIPNLMTFAEAKFKVDGARKLIWSGVGNAVTKTVSCAEIMKRKFKNLHQLTVIHYISTVETWEPKIPNLEKLQVKKDIPAISILLSKDEIDPSTPGYQGPLSSVGENTCIKTSKKVKDEHAKKTKPSTCKDNKKKFKTAAKR